MFFSDALMSATTSLKEYSFLVKKVVFEIKVLPIVKIIASFYIHLVFIGIVTILYVADGYIPTVYNLQLIIMHFVRWSLYWGLGILPLPLMFSSPIWFRLSTLYCSLECDDAIMWSPSLFGPVVERIIKINPMYYIVEGYRDSFYNHIPFWDKPGLTIYFWCIALILLIAGCTHFESWRNISLMYFSKKGDSMEHCIERSENIVYKQVNAWKLYKDGTEKKDTCRVSLFPMTGLCVLTLSVSENLQEIVFSPESDAFIACRIINALDTFKAAVSCEAIDACSYNESIFFSHPFLSTGYGFQSIL